MATGNEIRLRMTIDVSGAADQMLIAALRLDPTVLDRLPDLHVRAREMAPILPAPADV